MARIPKDIAGQRFGKLVAVKNTGEKNKSTYLWMCKCDCGNEKIVAVAKLCSGNTKSCGCSRIKNGKRVLAAGCEEGTRIGSITQKIKSTNKSGVKGISWDKKRKLWISCLELKGVNVLYKRFDSKQDAINARKEAEENYFKPILEKYGKTV